MRTLIPLLLNLKLLRQILLRLPLDLRPDSLVVHEIARVADLLLVDVRLLQLLVLEVLVRREGEDELEAGLAFAGLRGEILDADIGEVLERAGITLGDDLGEADVVSEGGKPELGDRGGGGGGVKCDMVRVVLQGLLVSTLELFLGRLS